MFADLNAMLMNSFFKKNSLDILCKSSPWLSSNYLEINEKLNDVKFRGKFKIKSHVSNYHEQHKQSYQAKQY